MKTLAVLFVFFSLLPEQGAHAGSKSSLVAFGDLGQHLVPASALFFSLSKGDRVGAVQLVESYLVTLGTVYGIKYSTCCTRPYGGKYSFPSGHTASAFVGTAYLSERYGTAYAVPAFAISTVVGYSRTQSHNHHMRDVVIGAFMAYIAAVMFTDPYQKKSLVISPLCEEGCRGVSFTKNF